MDLVEVIVRFDTLGNIQPLSFVWNGRKYNIASSGRSWKDEQGSHFLVMATIERVYELVFVVKDGLWYLKPTETLQKHV